MKKNLIFKVILSADTNGNNNFELLLSSFQSQLAQLLPTHSRSRVAIQGILITENAFSSPVLSSEELTLLPNLNKIVSDVNQSFVELAGMLHKPKEETFLKDYFVYLERMKRKLTVLLKAQDDLPSLLSSLCDTVEQNMGDQVFSVTLLESTLKTVLSSHLTKDVFSSKNVDGLITLNTSTKDLEQLIENKKSFTKKTKNNTSSIDISSVISTNKTSKKVNPVKTGIPIITSESLPVDVKQQFDAVV